MATSRRQPTVAGVHGSAVGAELMHPRVFQEFETICAAFAITGRVLEIGASPRHQSLLTMRSLHAASERLGVGLDGDAAGPGFRIINADAHDLSMFADGNFDLVLCNSMMEHDPQFWLTAAEARRVAASRAWLVFGVPGFGRMGTVPRTSTIRFLSRLPLIGASWRRALTALQASSPTLGLHEYPGDYYRFSEFAMAQVLLAGLEAVETRLIMEPPRVIGIGRKPAAAV